MHRSFKTSVIFSRFILVEVIMKVFVYYNLTKKKFSIRSEEGPKKNTVIIHTDSLILKNVEFKVSESGRQRVIKEQRKNVHAGVVGDLILSPIDMDDIKVDNWTEIYYNPYKTNSFVNLVTNEKITSAGYAYLDSKKVYIPS